MSAHRLPTDMLESPWTQVDPGNAGTITVFKNFAQISLVSAGAETRTLARPTRQGLFCSVFVQTYVGAITLTVTGGYNVAGFTTMVFSAQYQYAMFMSVYDGTNYVWQLISASNIGNLGTPGTSRVITATGTLSVTALLHANRTIALSAVGGFVCTLPAATGTGNAYTFVVQTINTGTSTYEVSAAGSDKILGTLQIVQTGSTYATANIGESFLSTTNVNVTIGNATGSFPTGGKNIGDWFEVMDIASAVWAVTGFLTAGTTPTTPFS